MLLKGKTALVTGGTGGLGRVVVRRLNREGARVCITSRGPIASGNGPRPVLGKILQIRGDVTTEKGVSGIFRTLSSKVGTIDILVNTVGGFVATGSVRQTKPSDWRTLMETNLTSVFLCCRAFLRQKGMRNYGRIFNFSAQTVLRPARDRAAYAVSKGGVAILTELLGEELRGTGITANAFAPSILDTVENRRAMPDADHSLWVDPAVIADAMVHLCGPGSSAINGAIIPVFGGV